ncbi:MAG TPA: AMP-binding protein [Syntrophales bacterium]|mgnify:CR=1 FL=1|nr:AMP-binding protein [Syntrophales bacterium]
MIDRPWLENYDAGVPSTLEPYPGKTLFEDVADVAKEKPDHRMVWFKGRWMSYKEIDRLSDVLAAGLAAIGVKKGDRVVMLLPNCPNTVISQLAIWKAGAISVPINPLYSEAELEFALNECGAEVAIVLTAFYGLAKKMQPRTRLRQIIATSVKEYLSPFLKFMFTLLVEKKQGQYLESVQGNDLWLQELMKKHAGDKKPDVRVTGKDTGLLLFSGGTTGTPKAVMVSHEAILMIGRQVHCWSTPLSTDWVDTLVLLMPFFHVYGNVGLLSTAIAGRFPVALIANPRDLDDILTTIKKLKPAFFPAISAIFIGLMSRPEVISGKIDFKSMKSSVAAGAPLLPETKRQWEAITGGKIVETYGLTESGVLAMGPYLGKWKEGAVGLPIPDTVIKIVDIDTGRKELKPGETGEIIAKAPQLMQGYWNNPEATAEMLRDGWLYTGDVGHLDEDGYLFITSRKKELIKPSGHQVFPIEIEEIIAQHPAVLEVGVAGVPDAAQGEAVKAWVVLRPEMQCTEEEIQAFCRGKLTAYKVPKLVEFREALPKSLVGKVLRRVLQEEHRAKGK